jgi:hypothetical protein
MSRIIRIAEMYHQNDHDKTNDLTTTVEGYTAADAADKAAALVIPVTHGYVGKTVDGTEALTLANGKPGQIVVVNAVAVSVGTGTLTPATTTGFSTIAFADTGDQAILLYIDDTIGWIIMSALGLVQPPVIA